MTQPILEMDHITISRDKHEKIHLVKPLKLEMKENRLMYTLGMMIEESIWWWWWYHMTIALKQLSQRCGQKLNGMHCE